MNSFLNDNFLLRSKTAERLYHEFAKEIPIIDYHNHLSPEEIAEDKIFDNITQAWLYGDHYKWRAMRTNGVKEEFITGPRSDQEKFEQWAATVPYTMRNPLYHWTHLELKRYFAVDDLLKTSTAKKIYDECSEKLSSPEYSVKQLLLKMNVELLCTTDDPADNLEHHKKIRADNFEIKVLPAFRPDQAMNTDPIKFKQYLQRIEIATNSSITNFNQFLEALKNRHDYFASVGCTISDHGLDEMYADEFTIQEASSVFEKLVKGILPDIAEQGLFKSAMLYHFAIWDHEKGWVQQYHLGAQRNNNSRKMTELGADTGWDSIGDNNHAYQLGKFLDRLDKNNQLAKTILYNLNPSSNEVFATMTGNFNDGSVAGKVQWGAAWWYLDQKDGMTRHINTLSSMGMLSRFVGMLTDSRSFLSFPRHEYFRRLLCNLFAEDIIHGELPDDINWIGKLIQDICYNNNKQYFGWKV